MWLDAETQRRKVIDTAIVVAAYFYKNENLRIDQRLKVISMCLHSLFSITAPLIDRPESDLKLLTAVWVRAYKNAWNLEKSIATFLFTFPREEGGLQVKLLLGTLFTSVWGNLERCSQFDDGTTQLLAICYREAPDNCCLDLLGLQDTSQHPSWKKCWKLYLGEWEMFIRLSERPLDSKVLASENLDFSSILCVWGMHGLAVVFRIGSGSGVTDWVTYRSKTVPFSTRLESPQHMYVLLWWCFVSELRLESLCLVFYKLKWPSTPYPCQVLKENIDSEKVDSEKVIVTGRD